MSAEVDDFLAHFGVPGMRWGKHKAKVQMYDPVYRPRSKPTSKAAKAPSGEQPASAAPAQKQKMSRNKKIAIGIGIGAVAAIGAAVVLSSMNKNMDLPIDSLVKSASTSKGKALVAKAAVAPKLAPTVAPKSAGLDLGKVGGSAPNILGKRLERAGLSPADLNVGQGLNLGPSRKPNYAAPSMPKAPSLDTLSNLMNGGPQVTYNSKTGKYETK
jgi:hypothetical protein